MRKKASKHLGTEDESSFFEEKYEECKVCHQEYTGTCPLNSARCPFEADALDEDEEDEGEADFDDVDNLDALLQEDEEAERLIEEEGDIPPEDLKDD